MATNDERRVVWVLGAGFSQGLGGPLLKNLFTDASEQDLYVRYPQSQFAELHGPAAKTVRWLYKYGRGETVPTTNGKQAGELLWSNAEDFIEYLDLATEPKPGTRPHHARLSAILLKNPLVANTLEELRTAARRLIAGECSGFLEGADARAERWKPFRRWAQTLVRPNDTIVTFNYDRVVEILRDDHVATIGSSGLEVVLPEPDAAPTGGCCPVLKLHGSVDWAKHLSGGKPTGKATLLPNAALHVDERFIAIATPGPSKMREALGLRVLWNLATDAIKDADAIVFIGFRFPETDAYPREVLLDAIQRNRATQRDRDPVMIHVVLGETGFDSRRLTSLLRFVGPRNASGSKVFYVREHPLYGQDFLAVVGREDLFEPIPSP